MSRLGERIVSDLEGLVISEGRYRGKNMVVLPWQRDVCFAMEEHLIMAISLARGGGKTTLIAGVACSALSPGGALFVPRGEVVLIASSLRQAQVAFRHIYYFLRPIIEEKKSHWRVVNNSHHLEIEHRPSGTVLKALGSDPRRAHGLAPSLVVCDEGAKWVGGGREMYAALMTSMGKQTDSRLFAIGTRPDSEDHWFAEMLDHPGNEIHSVTYAADKGDDDFDEATWRKANPSWDHMPDLRKTIAREAEQARDGGQALSQFRALRLNMGTPEVAGKELIVSLENWKAIADEPMAEREGPVFVGIDLGGGTSMSAVAFYWPVSGRLEAYGAFPAEPSLSERGKMDYVGERYLRMKERGELFVFPGRATNNPAFLRKMMEKIDGEAIEAMIADTYKDNDVQQALATLGMNPDTTMTWRRVGGGKDGLHDVRAFQSEVLTAHMTPGDNLALSSAISEAVLRSDQNANRVLDKSRHKGRIDVLQAAVLAVGAGQRWREPSGGGGLDDFYSGMLESKEELVAGV